MKSKFLTFSSACLFLGAVMTACANTPNQAQNRIANSPQFNGEKFVNAAPTEEQNLANFIRAGKDFYFNKDPKAVPEKVIPTLSIEPEQLAHNDKSNFKFSRLGHSTLLIQLDGKFWLTDPIFSERASPVQFAGPKRFHPVPLEVEALPEIEAVIISHNHYDHLDYGSIQSLKEKTKHFLVPLGIGNTLKKWGVAENKITELDWWENKKIGDVELIATPAQHFSGRGLFDGDKALWASWVMRSQQHSIFFSGDTGYFDGFKTIGEKYGPFDFAFMECGAYNQLWRDIHMMPEDTLQAFLDVKAKTLVPVHNGTFDLSTHAWFDPFEQINALAQQHNVTLLTPTIGQIIDGKQPVTVLNPWWLDVLNDSNKNTLVFNNQ